MKTRGMPAVAALVLGVAGTAWAQKSVTETVTTKFTATVHAIDVANRVVVLKDDEAGLHTFQAGAHVQRFNALKVGDRVTFRYTESVAYDLRKPGERSNPAGEGESVSRGPGPKPSGSYFKSETSTVTVEAVDAKLSSITVRGEDGSKVTHTVKPENRKALVGVKAGDRIDISYTQSVAIEAAAPGPK